MADTQRTIAALLNLFRDNQSDGSISEQDLRDAILSIAQVPFGGMYTLNAVETIISTQGVYTKSLGTTQISSVRAMDMAANNRLRYTGVIPYHFHISVSLSMTSAGNNKLASFRLLHHDDSEGTDTTIVGSQVNRFMSTGADEGSTALHWDIILENNDWLELHVANLTDTSNITVTNFYVFAMGMLV